MSHEKSAKQDLTPISLDGVNFDNIQIEYHTTDGLDVPYIDLQSLIKNKRSTGRLRDLADCEELEKRL